MCFQPWFPRKASQKQIILFRNPDSVSSLTRTQEPGGWDYIFYFDYFSVWPTVHNNLCWTALFFHLLCRLIAITALFYNSCNTINPEIQEPGPGWGFCLCEKAALPRRRHLRRLLSVGTNGCKTSAIRTGFSASKCPEITQLQYGITQIELWAEWNWAVESGYLSGALPFRLAASSQRRPLLLCCSFSPCVEKVKPPQQEFGMYSCWHTHTHPQPAQECVLFLGP